MLELNQSDNGYIWLFYMRRGNFIQYYSHWYYFLSFTILLKFLIRDVKDIVVNIIILYLDGTSGYTSTHAYVGRLRIIIYNT